MQLHQFETQHEANHQSDYLTAPNQHSSRSRSHHPGQFSTTAPNTPNDASTSVTNMVGPSHPMPRQRVYFGPYLLLQTLGEGEFGKVKLGVHSSPERWGEEVAIKLIKRGNVDTQARMIKVAREIDVLKMVKHPNIVRLYDVIETEKYIGIVLEYASGGELFDHILAHRYLKEKDASRLFAQLISGVTYLHNKKIVHRDLKLENLLLDRNRNIIITDFGFANRFEDRTNDLMATSCGSPCYAAPELVVQDGRYVGSQVDVWSCGVILYAMLAGYLPFDDDPSNPDGDNINLLYKYIINTPLSFPDWISAEPRDLLLKMLVPDPLKRCSLKDVTSHPWLSKFQHLFHRTLEELERISEENEQNKRVMLQRQRQMMVTGSRPSAGGDISRSLSTAANGPGNGASKSRGHQSAMVVPSSSLGVDDGLAPHNPSPTGAYHQQQRQQAAGTVTHLQSNPNPPTAIPVLSNRRNHEAQSAVVVPVSGQIQEMAPEPVRSAGTETYSSAGHKGKSAHEIDPKASSSSPGSGKKRKVGNSTASPGSGKAQQPHVSHAHQRYTVQVEYGGSSAQEDIKGKAKVTESPKLPTGDEPTAEAAAVATADDDTVKLTPELSSSPASPNDMANQISTPQPARARQSTVPSPSALASSAVEPRASRKSSISNETDEAKILFPSPESTKVLPSNAVNLAISPKGNQSQVSFGKTSQASTNATSGAKTDASKAQTRHRKGLSTDRLLARLLGGNSGTNSTNILNPPVPATPSNATKKHSGFTTAAPPTSSKVARRKALSMVVEPLSGKSSLNSAARAARKSTKGGSPSNSVKSPTPVEETTKRRTRGSSVVAAAGNPAVGVTSPKFSAVPPMPPKRRTTLTPGSKKHDSRPPTADVSTPHLVVTSQVNSQNVQSNATVNPSVEEEKIKREVQNASPNWSHHTTATNGGNSIGQASNSSKAKRVMDWFRFKSLNNSSSNQIQQTGGSDLLTPPTPIRTDFDAKRKTKESTKSRPPSSSGSNVLNTQVMPSNLKPAHDNNALSSGIPTPMVSIIQPQQSETSTTSSRATHRFTLAHPRPSTAATPNFGASAGISPSASSTSPNAFSDAKLKLHHGAIDQNAISSRAPTLIMQQLKQILWELGIDVAEENPMKLKATRRSKKKVVASLGMGVFEALQQQQQLHQQNQSLVQPPGKGTEIPGAGFKFLFQRKASIGSNQNSQIGVLIDQFGQVSAGTHSRDSAPDAAGVKLGAGGQAQPLPAYADDPSVDSGEDVRFTVEVTRLRGLVGLYAVDIKRLKGSVWSFKYLYLQILERADLGKKT
ncbi:CAMK/CAMKL/KIN4 protein kinase [Phakopsora pachyrhizi]|uniref:non-specific serine/threonine protein kinase n=1 Tax=Phakopsora pachyrhizi TaxID=170000 RepID=A0AAV0AJR5_PHAPC|nr:CAMK/CAMKL/KIN4 protein kinase [Phakopsora pachyrhizi]CAH7668767.1 CAMK/CAMKL/KIN4 protein kinase [Phakopsora pachyrhizi]